MNIFSNNDRKRIEEAITDAEKRTSGEVITLVTYASDNYRFFALLWAALIALTVPLILIYVPELTGWKLSWTGPETYYLIQLVVFILASLFFQWAPIRYATVPGYIKRETAHQLARTQFLTQNLHKTKQRTGVLIFISWAEHYAEVLADDDIYQKVDPSVWDQAVNLLTEQLSKDEPANGIIEAIHLCGDVLAEHFPPGLNDHNELPNHLIEIN